MQFQDFSFTFIPLLENINCGQYYKRMIDRYIYIFIDYIHQSILFLIHINNKPDTKLLVRYISKLHINYKLV